MSKPQEAYRSLVNAREKRRLTELLDEKEIVEILNPLTKDELINLKLLMYQDFFCVAVDFLKILGGEEKEIVKFHREAMMRIFMESLSQIEALTLGHERYSEISHIDEIAKKFIYLETARQSILLPDSIQ